MSRKLGKRLFLVLSGCLLMSNPWVALAQDGAAASSSAPASTASAPETPDAASNNITLDFKEADINTVLRVMSLKSKINIVAGPEVQGTVTIRLENVPWEKALDVVLRTYGYVYERSDNIIRVTTRDNLAQEPLLTQTFVLNYSKAAEIQTAIQDMLTERGRIKISERTNTIVLTDIPTNIYTISEVLKKLDRLTPQAFIDSKIVKTDVASTENLGIEWKTGGLSNNLGSLTGASRPTTFPFPAGVSSGGDSFDFLRQFYPPQVVGGTPDINPNDLRGFPTPAVATNPTNSAFQFGTLSLSSFNAVLQMLKARTNTKVVSNPRIVVLNNQQADIHVGDNIPLPKFETNSTTGRLNVSGFDYDKLKTGVQMKVTPHINSADEILVDLEPSVNSRGATITFNSDLSAPIINETTAKTQVLIKSGETIAVGGLLTDSVQVDESKVPYLGDVPIVGKLFRSKRQTAGSGNEKVETLFFVTVTMIDTEGQRVEKEKGQNSNGQPANAAAPAPSVPSSSIQRVAASASPSAGLTPSPDSGADAGSSAEAVAPAVTAESQPETKAAA